MRSIFCDCGFEIIDFHTHPFTNSEHNISAYGAEYPVSDKTVEEYTELFGISRFCGSVIDTDLRKREGLNFDSIRALNDTAIELRDKFFGKYIPGIAIHPEFEEESALEIERCRGLGVKLIGEIVPHLFGWGSYAHKGLNTVLEAAAAHGMVFSFHTMAHDTVEDMIKAHPNVTFVAAHPGERKIVEFHTELMKKYENYCLDISGTGIFRWQMLRYILDKVGSERILFGSDYPTCNPGVYIGGVLGERISDKDKENIFSKNAKRILGIS